MWVVTEVPELDRESLDALTAARIPAVRLSGFATQDEVESLGGLLVEEAIRTSSIAEVTRLGISQYQEGLCGSKERYFELARIGSAGERNLDLRVDDQFEKQFGKASTNQRFVSHQDRPEFLMSASVERWPRKELHQGAPGIQCQLATVPNKQGVGRGLWCIWRLCFVWQCGLVILRPVH